MAFLTRKTHFALIAILCSTLGLAACQNPNDPYAGGFGGSGPKQTVGTLGGAVLGGLAGAQFGKGSGRLWTTGIGTLLGAYLGNEIGQSLDRADQAALSNAELEARRAPIGKTIRWNNPESGNYGTITPVRDGTDSYGAYCREFQQSITVGGKSQRAYGTACRQPDGQWEIVSQ